MALTKDERKMLIEIRTVLLGAEGEDNGLCAEVKRLAKGHAKLKLTVWVLITFLIGSGIIATSILELIK